MRTCVVTILGLLLVYTYLIKTSSLYGDQKISPNMVELHFGLAFMCELSLGVDIYRVGFWFWVNVQGWAIQTMITMILISFEIENKAGSMGDLMILCQ